MGNNQNSTPVSSLSQINNMTLEQLSAEMPEVRQRINNACADLMGYFQGKNDVIKLLFLGATANTPILIQGPPGTAKSDMIVRFSECLGVSEKDYFEYMLNKFTEPAEIMGPVDINKLKEGAYVRNTAGKLPEAEVVFLDEIFKSNSAILNTLLTVINEGKFYQNGVPTPVRMKVLFAATNEIPEHSELNALKDRFILKIPSNYVQDDNFDGLIQAGLEGDLLKAHNSKPWKDRTSLADFLKVRRYMSLLMRKTVDSGKSDQELYFPDATYALFKRIIGTLNKDLGVAISDRKVIKLYRILRTKAFLERGGTVEPQDLLILMYTANRIKDFEAVADKVRSILRMSA